MSQDPSNTTVDVLIVSSRENFWLETQVILKGYYPYKLHHIKTVDDIFAMTENFKPVLALVDGNGGTAKASEWVQGVKMTYSDCPLIVLYGPEDNLDFALVKKNGADHIMHVNYDREFVSDMVLRLAPVDLKGTDIPLSALLPIDLKDIDLNEAINFDVYIHIPSSHKSFRIRKAGGHIEERLFDKAGETHQRLYIKKSQTRPFFEYARTVLTMRNEPNPVPMTEKIYKSKQLIHEIISEFFNSQTGDFSAGKAIYDRCRQIISELDLTQGKDDKARTEEVYRFTGYYRSTYQDAINMAIFASNFAALSGMKPELIEAAAIAGLLHNVGMAQMPSSSFGKTVKEFTPEEIVEYQRYPDRSIFLVKSKKVPLNVDTTNGIMQHQENADGSGFPKHLPSADMTPIGKVMRLAMRFLELTSSDGIEPGVTPKAAMSVIRDEAISGKAAVDLVTITQVHKKFST